MQKYSVQQIQTAVQHYLDNDRCIASTVKALGYPSAAPAPVALWR